MKRLCIFMIFACLVETTYGRKKMDETTVQPLVVQRIDAAAASVAADFVYILPRTALRITVKVERTIFMRGIYAEYAEKYLGILGVGRKDEERYELRYIDVSPMQEADHAEIYAVRGAPSVPAMLFKMQEAGLVMMLPVAANSTPAAVQMPYGDWAIPPFTDMGYEVAAYKTEAPKQHFSDSARQAVHAVPIASPVPKGKEAQAIEAAKIIVNIRRRRLELVSGEIPEVFASDYALKTGVDEMKDAEHHYLELFIGKSERTLAQYVYDIIPEKGKERYPLFLFSEDNGIESEAQANVVLHLQCQHPFVAPDATISGYKYRIPCIANLKITDNDIEIFRGRYAIFQYGKVVSFVVN